MRKAAIIAITTYLPEETLTNDQLAHELGNWDSAQILEKTGIAVRHIAAPDECSSDLGVAAAKKLFELEICTPDEIDFLLFCTQSPDYYLPASACLIQNRLGLRTDCGALDFNQGCSGFVYGLSLAKSLIETGLATNVLLITAETYSKFINPRDRSVRTIFGDGASATLIQPVESEVDLIGPFVFGTDGRGANNLIVPAGGLRQPYSIVTAIEHEYDNGNTWRSAQNLYMNGPEIFNFTLQSVPKAVNQLLQKSDRKLAQVNLFVFHQANKFMLQHLRNKLKIAPEKFWLNLELVGNTVSSTIPIALESARQEDKIHPGNQVMIVGFGVGYSWAGAMIQII
ncbi:MAG: ketoacyl-ACP synthase III [Chloroflexi bacterium]|nr:ketoacyl-ACP synthase III [Chloroflexota bacterium]